MDLQLPSPATACCVTGREFVEGDRVVSVLVRGAGVEVARSDLLAEAEKEFQPGGAALCRWVHVFKPRAAGENPDRALKLTAENLFLTLADPASELSADNVRLVQFLAVMLERKRVLRPKGRSADGAGDLYEHAKTKQVFTIPAVDLTPEFFVGVQEQLGALLGDGTGPR